MGEGDVCEPGERCRRVGTVVVVSSLDEPWSADGFETDGFDELAVAGLSTAKTTVSPTPATAAPASAQARALAAGCGLGRRSPLVVTGPTLWPVPESWMKFA